ncbi:MAG: membrane protein insertion efficiency factor YidD [Syntrophomonadaceae bacterium]|jgi:putative membrane protein insertion efficiency factor|nr:membrane protein insertion efficiency factor YidD [Syntrophomonadaceae bacterium]
MLKRTLIVLIKIYQQFKFLKKSPTCIYYPSCSMYSIEAIDKYGIIKGGWLSVSRILRCHPFHSGGYDPVP